MKGRNNINITMFKHLKSLHIHCLVTVVLTSVYAEHNDIFIN